ncbi:hypothetical protein BV901_10300 [Serratia nematodiphila]|nr:hypothetical protein BV901_10300 [Serratia nematodiphila]
MKPYVTVLIQDQDRFFAQGIEHLLRSHFSRKGREIRVVAPNCLEVVDLLILVERAGWPLHPCRLSSRTCRHGRTAIIVVTEAITRKRRHRSPCLSELGVLERRDAPEVVLNLADRMLPLQKEVLTTSDICVRCAMMLTPREHQVLRCMSCGLTASRVAWVLKITEKTVSAHKRSAMRKLGFRRSGELYQWLLRGGLEYEKRALS